MKNGGAGDESVAVHVAILPSPGTGHIIPHLEFAKRLISLHNFKITFIILSTETSITQTQLLLQSQTLPSNLQILHLPPVDISPFSDSTQIQIQTKISIIIRESLPHIHFDPSNLPNLLIVDLFATDAFQIADQLEIPKFIFFTSPAELFAFMIYLPTLDRELDDSEFVHLPDPVIRVPGCNPIRIIDLPEVTRDRNRDGYKWYLHHSTQFSVADGILVNTCQDLESKTLKALQQDPILRQIPTPRVYPVGPIIKTADDSSTSSPSVTKPDWLTWLDQQPLNSVLFVSFGSGGALTAKQLTELAWGLELSQQRFIWIARRPIHDELFRNFLDVGGDQNDPSGYLPDGFLGRIKGRGLVVRSWAPQVEILSHGSTGGFFSHCGWNSSLESMYYGVPMIAWPLYAEQMMNATMLVEEIGVAVRGKNVREIDGLVGREEIERVVRLVMEGGREEGRSLRERVAEVREMVVRAVNEEDGSSCVSLNEVAKEWKSKCCK